MSWSEAVSEVSAAVSAAASAAAPAITTAAVLFSAPFVFSIAVAGGAVVGAAVGINSACKGIASNVSLGWGLGICFVLVVSAAAPAFTTAAVLFSAPFVFFVGAAGGAVVGAVVGAAVAVKSACKGIISTVNLRWGLGICFVLVLGIISDKK